MPLVLRPKLTNTEEHATRARLERWICIGCGHEWRRGHPPPYCRHCGVVGGYAPEEIELIGARSEDVDDVPDGVIVPEWSEALPRGLPLGRTLLLRGRPGGGKSRSAFRLAPQIGQAMIFGLEMGKSHSVETATNAGAKLENIWWYEDIEGLSELELLNPAVVVIDSIQKLGRDRKRIVEQLRDWAKDAERNVIFISQLSADGKSRYGEDDDFYADMNVDVSPGRTDKGPRKMVHGFADSPTRCADGCCHVSVAKSRVCPLIAFDVPIVAGF